MKELEFLAQKIKEAKYPEEIFGNLEEKDKIAQGRSIYRQLVKATHPDLYSGFDADLAVDAFKRLTMLWEAAQQKLNAGTYGIIEPPKLEIYTVKSRKREYQLKGDPVRGDFANLFKTTYESSGIILPAHFKIVRDPSDNDLLENEARLLKILSDGDGFEKFKFYFPDLIDSFQFRDKSDPRPRQVNVLSTINDELYSLEDVKKAYPRGVDLKDIAWIYRRLLVGLGFAHANGIIDGAVVPSNVFIQPEKHGLIIAELSFGAHDPISSGERIKAINNEYKSFYPPEVVKKEVPTPSLDIFMASKCMNYLIDSGSRNLDGFFAGCMLPLPNQRPQNAWELKEEFDQLIEGLWGPRKFHPFSMPEKDKSTFR